MAAWSLLESRGEAGGWEKQTDFETVVSMSSSSEIASSESGSYVSKSKLIQALDRLAGPLERKTSSCRTSVLFQIQKFLWFEDIPS